LWAVVADLPSRQRQALVLRHVGQLREEEVGAVMGISRGAVSSTLRAGYQSLRIALADPAPVSEAR
jgi:RNA polymerase sigma-70 factor (ECF subfamily)